MTEPEEQAHQGTQEAAQATSTCLRVCAGKRGQHSEPSGQNRPRRGPGCGLEAHAQGRGHSRQSRLRQAQSGQIGPSTLPPPCTPGLQGLSVGAGLPEKVAISEDLSLHKTPCQDRGQVGQQASGVLLLISPFVEEETGEGGWAACPESQERVSGAPSLGSQLQLLCSAQRWPRAPGEVHLGPGPRPALTVQAGRAIPRFSLLLQPGPTPTLTPSPPPSPGICLLAHATLPRSPLTSPAHQH